MPAEQVQHVEKTTPKEAPSGQSALSSAVTGLWQEGASLWKAASPAVHDALPGLGLVEKAVTGVEHAVAGGGVGETAHSAAHEASEGLANLLNKVGNSIINAGGSVADSASNLYHEAANVAGTALNKTGEAASEVTGAVKDFAHEHAALTEAAIGTAAFIGGGALGATLAGKAIGGYSELGSAVKEFAHEHPDLTDAGITVAAGVVGFGAGVLASETGPGAIVAGAVAGSFTENALRSALGEQVTVGSVVEGAVAGSIAGGIEMAVGKAVGKLGIQAAMESKFAQLGLERTGTVARYAAQLLTPMEEGAESTALKATNPELEAGISRVSMMMGKTAGPVTDISRDMLYGNLTTKASEIRLPMSATISDGLIGYAP